MSEQERWTPFKIEVCECGYVRGDLHPDRTAHHEEKHAWKEVEVVTLDEARRQRAADAYVAGLATQLSPEEEK